MSGPLRVLIAEDSATDAKLVVQALRIVSQSVEFERVDDAAAMRAALKRQAWDLVISDWSMPKFRALGALEVLQETGLDLPFIVVSGTVGEEAAVDVMRAGAHDYVLKDNLARLVPAVERELREYHERVGRRRAEENARAQEDRFRGLVEHSADGIILTGADGTLLYASPAMGRMLGTHVAVLVGGPAIAFIHPDDREHVGSVMAGIREAHATVMTVQFRALHQDGSSVWMEATATNMLADLAVGAIVGNIRDITEHRRVLDDLRLSEVRRKCLADSLAFTFNPRSLTRA